MGVISGWWFDDDWNGPLLCAYVLLCNDIRSNTRQNCTVWRNYSHISMVSNGIMKHSKHLDTFWYGNKWLLLHIGP